MFISLSTRQKIIFTRLVAATLLIVLITYSYFQRPNLPPPTTSISMPPKQGSIEQEELSTGSPVRIIIPKINVNAVLEYVGLTPEGEMDEPTEASNAAWLNRHPLPGEAGTSVIAGHFGFKDNKPAVFDNLHKLTKGDELFIEDSKGTVIAFAVQELRDYVPEQDAKEVFDSSDGKSHLNLITCKGAWNESLQSYDTRLVVFADRIVL